MCSRMYIYFGSACRWFAPASQTWGWGMYNLGITLSVITHFKSNTAVFSLILVYFAWKLCNHEKNKWFWIKLICLLSITLPIIFSVNWLVYNIITNHIFSKPSWHLQMSCFVQITITGTTTPNSQLYIYWLKTICFSSRLVQLCRKYCLPLKHVLLIRCSQITILHLSQCLTTETGKKSMRATNCQVRLY